MGSRSPFRLREEPHAATDRNRPRAHRRERPERLALRDLSFHGARLVGAEPRQKNSPRPGSAGGESSRSITEKSFTVSHAWLTPRRSVGRALRRLRSENTAFLCPSAAGSRGALAPEDLDLIRLDLRREGRSPLSTGSIPARVVRVDVATGQREPWKEPRSAGADGSDRIGPDLS